LRSGQTAVLANCGGSGGGRVVIGVGGGGCVLGGEAGVGGNGVGPGAGGLVRGAGVGTTAGGVGAGTGYGVGSGGGLVALGVGPGVGQIAARADNLVELSGVSRRNPVEYLDGLRAFIFKEDCMLR